MIVKTLTKVEAQTELENWLREREENPGKLPALPSEYRMFRKEIQNLYKEAKYSAALRKDRKDYMVDMYFGVKLFQWTMDQKWFLLKYASDTGFWRYMTVKVVPDIVYNRWGENEDRFWKNPTRNYLRYVWWHAFLCWQGSEERTIEVLKSQNFNTDTAMNLCERTGRNGLNPSMTRTLVLYFSFLKPNTLKNLHKGKLTLFRAILKRNTAYQEVIEPSLCAGGCKGYVRYLFLSSGIKPELYPEIFKG